MAFSTLPTISARDTIERQKRPSPTAKFAVGAGPSGLGRQASVRVIYYWWVAADQFWLFTLYDKDEAADLTASERKALGALLIRELEARSTT